MNRTAGSRRRRLFGAGSTVTRDSTDARTSSSRHCPPFTLRSSKTRRCAQLSLCDRRRVPGGAGVSGRVAETAVGDAASGDERGAVSRPRSPTVLPYFPPGLVMISSSGVAIVVRRGAGLIYSFLEHVLLVQSNLAMSYNQLRRLEPASRLQQDVYSGTLKRYGEEHYSTLLAANNYASTLLDLQRFEEAKSLLRKTVLVARRVSGDGHDNTLRLRWNYARALYMDPGAALDDLREAATSLEETARIARRVLGGAHPLTTGIDHELQASRAVLGGISKGSN